MHASSAAHPVHRAALVAAVALLAIAGAASLPQTRAGAARAERVALTGVGRSEIGVLNLGADAADVPVRLAPAGAPVGAIVHMLGPVAAFEAAGQPLDGIEALSDGNYGADAGGEAFALSARTLWEEATAATTYGAPAVGTDLMIPFAAKFHHGQTTFVTVQNADPDRDARVAFTAIRANAANPTLEGEFEVPAAGSIGFWLGEGPTEALGDGWFGTLWLEAETPISAVALVSVEDGGSAVFESAGLQAAEGAPVWSVPRFLAQRRAGSGGIAAASRIAVANPSRRIAVLVTATMRGTAGACAGETFESATKTIRAGSNLVFDFGPAPDRDAYDVEVPDDCEGTVTFRTSVGDVIVWAVEEHRSTAPSQILAAGAFRPRSSRETAGQAFATVFGGGGGAGLGPGPSFTGMNVGAAAAELRLSFRAPGLDPDACGAACRAVVSPGEAHVWHAADLPELPAGAAVSVELTADEPVALLVEERPFGSESDVALVAGITPPDAAADPDAWARDHSRLPIVLKTFALTTPPRDPTPTATNTWTPFPSAIFPTFGTPTITPTAIPSRTPSPTPTEVPTEVPLGEVWLQSLDAGGPVEAELALVSAGGATSASESTGALGFGASRRIDLDPLAGVLGDALHGGVADGGAGLGALASLRARRGAAVAYSPPEPGQVVIVPLALIDYLGQWTSVAIQNASPDQTATVTVDLIPLGRSSYTRRAPSLVLAPGAARAYRLGIDPEFVAVPAPPEGFQGWMRISADGPVSVVSIVAEADSARSVRSVAGVPADSASTRFVAPSVQDYQDTRSAIELFNPGAEAATVTIAYRGVLGECEGASIDASAVDVPPYGSRAVGPATGDGILPEGCIATAVVDADRPVIAAVSGHAEDPDGADRVAGAFGYSAVPEAALSAGDALGLPRVRKVSESMISRVAVVNGGESATTAELTVFDAGGAALDLCAGPCRIALAPGEGGLWDFADFATLPSGFAGSAIIEGGPGLAAVVHDRSAFPGFDHSAYVAPVLGRSAPPRHLPMLNFAIKPGFVVGPTPTSTPWPTATARPTSVPGSGASDLISMQNLSESMVSTFVLANLLPEHAIDSILSVIRLSGLPGMTHRIDTRRTDLGEDYGMIPRAAVFNSDLPLGVVGRHIHPRGSVTTQNAGINSTDIVIPRVVDDPGGERSAIALAAGTDIFVPGDPGILDTAHIELFTSGGIEPVATADIRVPGDTFRRLDIGLLFDGAVLPRDASGRFEGWMRIRSESPKVAESTIGNPSDEIARYSLAGLPASIAAPELWAPLVHSAAGGFTSEILVFNPGGAPADVTVRYIGHGGSCAGARIEHAAGPLRVAPNRTGVVGQASAVSGLPEGCTAAAVVEALGAPILAWLVDLDGTRRAASYELFSRFDVGSRVALPLLYTDDEGRGTSVVVHYAEGVGATGPRVASLGLWNLAGSGIDCAGCGATLEPGGSFTFDIASLSGVPEGFEGSGEIRAEDGLIAVVVDAPTGGAGDVSMWRGIRAEVAAAGAHVLPFAISGAAPIVTPGPSPTSWPTDTPGPSPTPWTAVDEVVLPYASVTR